MRNINKQIGILLVAALVLGTMLFPVSAAGAKIDGYADRSLEEMFALGQSGSDPLDITLRSGEEIRIPLTADMFTWSDGRVPANMEALTTAQLRNGRVKVSAKKIKGSVTLDYLQFDTDVFPGYPFLKPGTTTRTGRTAHISVIMSREFVSTEDMEFAYLLYLTVDGQKYGELEILLSGTLLVDAELVDDGADYILMEEGQVIEADTFVRDVKLDLGKGVTIRANLFEGERYYGTAKIVEGKAQMQEELDGQLAGLPDLYPQLQLIYKLDAINIGRKTAATRTTIDVPGDDTVYHVYGEDLKYLGTTEGELNYSDMYLLATEPIPQFEEFVYDNLVREELEETAGDSGLEPKVLIFWNKAVDNPNNPGKNDIPPVYKENIFD